MANINEITVGSTVFVKEEHALGMAFIAQITGVETDNFGKVVAVEPTQAELLNYPEINPEADGTGKVIYFDDLANRHYIIKALMLDVAGAVN